MAFAVLAGLVACQRGPVRPSAGDAFQKPYGSYFRAHAVPPGAEWGLLIAFLHNVSGEPVTLQSVDVGGRGIGSVAKVLAIQIAPLPEKGTDFTPGGVYETYPPALLVGGRCQVQTLRRVSGYQMDPGDEARVLVLMGAEEAGRFRVDHHVVTYSIEGRLQDQILPVGLVGSVEREAPPVPLDRSERQCSDLTRILPLGGVGSAA